MGRTTQQRRASAGRGPHVTINHCVARSAQGIGSNIILGFDKSKANEVLEIEDRFRPELLITVGYTDEKLEPSYRLPVDEIIEKR